VPQLPITHCERPKGARQSRSRNCSYSMRLLRHCVPRKDTLLLSLRVSERRVAIHTPVIASDRRERGNLVILNDEIASVVTLPRKDSRGKIASSLRSSQRHQHLSLRATTGKHGTPHTCHCERPKGARQSRLRCTRLAAYHLKPVFSQDL